MYKFNTIFVGQELLHFPFLDSTNDYLKSLIAEGDLTEGLIVRTDDQRKGRGQRGSSWHSDPGKNLTFSIFLRPLFLRPGQQFLLTQIVSIALQKVVAELLPGKTVTIKWPNDIYVEGKKVAGILIENIIAKQAIHSCIVGIGLNVNQKEFPSPIDRATSLAIERGVDFELESLLFSLCVAVEQQYLKIKRPIDQTRIHQDYRRHLFLFDQKGKYQRKNGEQFYGKIIDAKEDGRLVMIVDGKEESFVTKQIQFIE